MSTSGKKKAINRIIDQALAAHRHQNRRRRHPADVTADRLGDATLRYDFTGRERDAIALVVSALREIAEGQRGPQ